MEALLKVEEVSGWPAPSAPLSASYPNLLLTRTIVNPSRVIPKRANFQWVYETLSGGSPTRLVIRDRTYAEQVSAQMIPGTWTEFRVSWANPLGDADQVEDIGTLNITIALRAISITAIRSGTESGNTLGLSDALQDKMNFVNADPFPLFARNTKPAGWWKLVEYNSELSVFENSLAVTATAVTRNISPWIDCLRLQRPGESQWLPIDQSELVTKMNLPYARGTEEGNGFLRVCAYPTANFGPLFGL